MPATRSLTSRGEPVRSRVLSARATTSGAAGLVESPEPIRTCSRGQDLNRVARGNDERAQEGGLGQGNGECRGWLPLPAAAGSLVVRWLLYGMWRARGVRICVVFATLAMPNRASTQAALTPADSAILNSQPLKRLVV